MIRASIYGRLGRDPEARTTANDKQMVTTAMAVDAARYGSDQETIWFDVVAFGTTAEALLRHAKGDLIAVMGQVTQRRYTGRDGTEKTSLSINAQSLVSARSMRPSGGGRKKAEGKAATGDRAAQHPNDGGGGVDPDDEIAF